MSKLQGHNLLKQSHVTLLNQKKTNLTNLLIFVPSLNSGMRKFFCGNAEIIFEEKF